MHTDLSDLESIPKVLEQLADLTGVEDIEVVYYNSARIKPSGPVLSVDAKEIEEDFKVRSICTSTHPRTGTSDPSNRSNS